ncbi:MAG: hypothetical protein ACPLKP_02425 [Microgenomates group bacterium]
MEPAQTLLIIVVCVLTFLLLLVGIQVFFILKEVQQSVKKVNKILDDAGIISESFSKPIASLSNSLGSLSGLLGFLTLFLKKVKERKEEEDGEE